MLPSSVTDRDPVRRPAVAAVIDAVIASDVRLLCDSLELALRDDPAIEVRGQAATAEALVQLVATAPATVALVDVAMPRALEATRAISHTAPDTRVVAVSVGPDVASIVACAEAGVAGYVSQDATLDELRRAVLEVSAGRTPCSPAVAAGLFRRLADLSAERERLPATPSRLTAREYEVLRLVQRGLSNKEIAARLQIALPTVKNHVHRIITKLDVSGRGAAADWLRA